MPTRVTYTVRLMRCLAPLLICATSSALQAQQRVDIRRAAVPDIAVRIAGSYAQIHVIGWGRDSIELTGSIPKGARLEGGMGTGGPAKGAKFWIEPPPSGEVGGTLELRVPLKARVWVKTGSAQVTAEGVTGSLDLNIVAGSINVRGNPSEATLESMDGTVTVDGSPEWMRIKTADGDVTVRGSCSDLAITTVSGVVLVREGKFERVRLESVTGAVTFAGDLLKGASMSVDTHSGAIELFSPVKTNLSIDARTLTGRIDNTLYSKRPTPGREGRGEELTLELGMGGAQAVLRSFKGSIRLASR